MTPSRSFWVALLTFSFLGLTKADAEENFSWIDPATGHRIVRLTDEAGLDSPYFHQNAFTPSGEGVVLYDTHTLWLYDRVKGSKHALYHWDDPAKKFSGVVVAHRSAHVYFIADAAIWVVELHTFHQTRITTIPREWARVSSLTINENETALAGVYTEGLEEIEETLPRDHWLEAINASSHPSLLFRVDIAGGNTQIIHRDDRWIDHPQFSPTDPNLLMLNFQIPAAEHQDTVFLIHSDGGDLHPVKKRTEYGETLIHSFFGPSGRQAWYDLQSPWGRKYFIGASRIDGSGDIRYQIDSSQWSYHYNLSHNENLIAGDGNPHYPDGKWIYLFRRDGNTLIVQKLVNLSQQEYSLEPNVQFTPDDKWILFRANFEGADHPYLVEVDMPSK